MQQLTITPSPPLASEELAAAATLLVERGWQPYAWNRANQPARYDAPDGMRTLNISPDEVVLTVEPGDEGAFVSVLDALLALPSDAHAPGRLEVYILDTRLAAAVEDLKQSGVLLATAMHDNGNGTMAAISYGQGYSVITALITITERSACLMALTIFADGEIAGEMIDFPLPAVEAPPGFRLAGHNTGSGRYSFIRNAEREVVEPHELAGFRLVSCVNRRERWQREDALGNVFLLFKRQYQNAREVPIIRHTAKSD